MLKFAHCSIYVSDRVMFTEFASPEFDEFLDLIGRRVQLKGFDQYRGGLDVKSMFDQLVDIYSSWNRC